MRLDATLGTVFGGTESNPIRYCGRPGSTLHRGCHRREPGATWEPTTLAEQREWAALIGEDGVVAVLMS